MPLVKNFDRIKRQIAPAGSYSKVKFGRALSPLWKKLRFRYDRDEDCLRAKLICERLYETLGKVMPLEDVYDMAEFLAEVVEPGQVFPDVDQFLPKHGKAAVLSYAEGRRKGKKTRKDLVRLGYRF